jgi:hypothetical protein
MSRCWAHSGTCDQIFLLLWNLWSLSLHPLWWEEGNAICSAITQWSESLRIYNRTLMSHLRLPQPRGPDSRINIPQEQSGPVILPGIGFPLRSPLRFAGLRRSYSNPLPTWRGRSKHIYPNHWMEPFRFYISYKAAEHAMGISNITLIWFFDCMWIVHWELSHLITLSIINFVPNLGSVWGSWFIAWVRSVHRHVDVVPW